MIATERTETLRYAALTADPHRLGGYARELGLVPETATLTLYQGEDMGRPGLLTVELRAGDPRVHVSGRAVRIP